MMTEDRDLKKQIRVRAQRTGESYQAARRQLLARSPVQTSLRPDDERAVRDYFEGWSRHVARWRETGGRWRPFSGAVPVTAMQAASLLHPSPKVRRECLGILDHAANDDSVHVFRHALGDPVPRVRLIALHALSCEHCRTGELCVEDVVADLVRTVLEDPSAKVRHRAVEVVCRIAPIDPRVGQALRQAAESDADELVRRIALAAAAGDKRAVHSRKALRRRTKNERNHRPESVE